MPRASIEASFQTKPKQFLNNAHTSLRTYFGGNYSRRIENIQNVAYEKFPVLENAFWVRLRWNLRNTNYVGARGGQCLVSECAGLEALCARRANLFST